MTVEELYRKGIAALKDISSSPPTESMTLLAFVLHKNREWILAHMKDSVDEITREKFMNVTEKRQTGYPLQYIVGRCFFFDLELIVEESVFIPRPETEVLVETALNLIEKNNFKTVIDIGTGSGAIAIALARHSSCHILANDISDAALSCARRNATKYGVLEKIEFRKGAYLEPFLSYVEKIDLIVSNPPYVSISYDPPVELTYEPKSALYAGNDGMNFYKTFFARYAPMLKSKVILMEMSPEQKSGVKSLLSDAKKISFVDDQFGRIRFFIAML